jgi:hypothetical protein
MLTIKIIYRRIITIEVWYNKSMRNSWIVW